MSANATWKPEFGENITKAAWEQILVHNGDSNAPEQLEKLKPIDNEEKARLLVGLQNGGSGADGGRARVYSHAKWLGLVEWQGCSQGEAESGRKARAGGVRP